MKNVPFLLSLFVITILFATIANAQSSPSPVAEIKPHQFFLKALYLDWSNTITRAAGSDESFKNRGGGITLVTKKNWMFSGKFTSGTGESPQKPAGYYPYRSNTGNSGGGGIINTSWIGNLQTNGNNSECAQACKDYKMASLFAGRMFYHPETEKIRLSVQGGVTFLKLDEAVDFIFHPGHDYNGYTFSQEEYNKIGASAKLGIEVPFSKFVGIGANLEYTIAKDERLFGLGIGLIVGLLR